MLKSIAMDFKIEPERSYQKQFDSFQAFLVNQYSEDKNVVIFIDEAQNVNNKQLELIRSILNFETDTHKLVQIVLAGQLELKDRLTDKRNKAVASRISTYSILSPLTFDETRDMILHRCKFENIANPFTPEAIEKIYSLSGGIPRSVLKICAFAYHIKEIESLDTITSEFVEMSQPEVIINNDLNDDQKLIKNKRVKGAKK
jgi:general secretion pathway protein A